MQDKKRADAKTPAQSDNDIWCPCLGSNTSVPVYPDPTHSPEEYAVIVVEENRREAFFAASHEEYEASL